VGLLLLVVATGVAGLLVALGRSGPANRPSRAERRAAPPAEEPRAAPAPTKPRPPASPPPASGTAKRAQDAGEGAGQEPVKAVAVVPRDLPPRQREALVRRIDASAEVIARNQSQKDRQRLLRHVRRFLVGAKATSPDAEGAWVDPQLSALQTHAAARVKPLPVPEPEEAEQRRLEQLDKLRRRKAVGLLDHIHGGLAWLALHQAPDGHFSDSAAATRCKKLGHDVCVSQRSKRYAVASTALALIALLDFRDQDVRGLFEPHLAAGVHWLARQQRRDGSFRGPGQLYTTAIALMALGQAAASTHSDPLREAVRRGLELLAQNPGHLGGYRYGPGAAGDLSVTGWVAQAVEMARFAKVELPVSLEPGLGLFLDSVWVGEHRFTYLSRGNERRSLYPVGMLMGHLLWPEPDPRVLATWRAWLTQGVGKRRPGLYTLYYGVRVAIALEEKLPHPWRRWVFELAKGQTQEGDAAGAFQGKTGRWLGRAGTTCQTAVAVLTLEHSLYLR
jgi:hypothetical protein